MKICFVPAVLLSFVLVGCGGGADVLSVYPVTGKITKAGVGVENVKVTLEPQEGTDAPLLIGRTDAEGAFEIITNAGQKGAPAGNYKVVLTPEEAEMDYSNPGKPKTSTKIIPKMYTSAATTEHSITVSADGKNEIIIDIK